MIKICGKGGFSGNGVGAFQEVLESVDGKVRAVAAGYSEKFVPLHPFIIEEKR